MENRAGTFRTNMSGELAYRSFVPSPLPPVPGIELDEDLLGLVVRANSSLSRLEEMSARIPDMNLFVSMYVRKEALMSSQIEGTQATLEDILAPEVSENANRDVSDVVNYIKATDYAVGRLRTLPLCNRLIKETHGVLMRNTRGQEKSPGEFRRSQNWIGGQGSSLRNARYIPPNPEDMETAMSELEKYMNTVNGTDNLIKAALIHYQFETIHPFLDGNGRIGRLLIILFLIEKKVISTPALYISYTLKRNRIEYYDRMTEVRTKGDYEQWVRFFLEAVIESSEDAMGTIDELSALRRKNEEQLRSGRISSSLKAVFDYIGKSPIMELGKTSQVLGISFNSVSSAVKRLVELGILVQQGDSRRNRTFVYAEYLDILRRGTV